jgi:hypothetical protein
MFMGFLKLVAAYLSFLMMILLYGNIFQSAPPEIFLGLTFSLPLGFIGISLLVFK